MSNEHGCCLAHRSVFDRGLSEVHCFLSASKKVLVPIERVAHRPFVTMQVAHP